MKTRFSNLQTSRRLFVLTLLTTAVLGGWLLAPEGRSQAPIPMTANAALIPLLAKLKSQQDAIAANQTKIEAQQALLKENLRQAKIYAARGGSGHR